MNGDGRGDGVGVGQRRAKLHRINSLAITYNDTWYL